MTIEKIGLAAVKFHWRINRPMAELTSIIMSER